MAYDRSDWHSGGDYPKELPEENAGTHIGIFLAWVINNDLIGEIHRSESIDVLDAVKNRTITGRDFLESQCDTKFWEVDLNEDGNNFAKSYYETGEYFKDYEIRLAGRLPTLYHVENTWENYDLIAPTISSRFSAWKSPKTPWWVFWK